MMSARLHGFVMRQCQVLADTFTAIGESVLSAEMVKDVTQLVWMLLLMLAFSFAVTIGVMCAVGLFLRLTA